MKHLKITLICQGGVSTGMLCEKIIKEAKKQDYDVECSAHGIHEAENLIESSDLILIGPQIKFAAKNLKIKFPEANIEVIDIRDYGTMNAENILKKCFENYQW